MTAPTLDITPAAAEASGTHCRAPRADGSGVCGKQLTDEMSVRLGIGPDCWERLTGAPPRAHGRRYPSGEEQDRLPFLIPVQPVQAVLPIDVPDMPLAEPADVAPGDWPWRIVAGVIACARGRCTAVLADGTGPLTAALIEAAARAHAPGCHAS